MSKPIIKYKGFSIYQFEGERRKIIGIRVHRIKDSVHTDFWNKDFRYVNDIKGAYERTVTKAKAYIDSIPYIRIKGIKKEKFKHFIFVKGLKGWVAKGARHRLGDSFTITKKGESICYIDENGKLMFNENDLYGEPSVSANDYGGSIKNAIRYAFLKTQIPKRKNKQQ